MKRTMRMPRFLPTTHQDDSCLAKVEGWNAFVKAFIDFAALHDLFSANLVTSLRVTNKNYRGVPTLATVFSKASLRARAIGRQWATRLLYGWVG